MPKIHILLIDDHAMFRSGLRMVLSEGIPNAVIFEASSLETVDHLQLVDVVVLDIKLPGSNGVEGIVQLKRQWPLVPVLMLSSLDTPETIQRALTYGAADFISKAESAEKIIEAIKSVVCKKSVVAIEKVNDFVPRNLTQRQAEVLELLGQGLSNKLVARQLFLSENTVRRHVQDILEFFEVASRAEAVVAARRRGMID